VKKILGIAFQIVCACAVMAIIVVCAHSLDVSTDHSKFERNFGFSARGLTDQQRLLLEPTVHQSLANLKKFCESYITDPGDAPSSRAADCFRDYNAKVEIAKNVGFTVPPLATTTTPTPSPTPKNETLDRKEMPKGSPNGLAHIDGRRWPRF
jgi:hypothetical protein